VTFHPAEITGDLGLEGTFAVGRPQGGFDEQQSLTVRAVPFDIASSQCHHLRQGLHQDRVPAKLDKIEGHAADEAVVRAEVDDERSSRPGPETLAKVLLIEPPDGAAVGHVDEALRHAVHVVRHEEPACGLVIDPGALAQQSHTLAQELHHLGIAFIAAHALSEPRQTRHERPEDPTHELPGHRVVE
jgi:hypothetical protein